MPCLSLFNNRYELYIDRHLIYRHRVNCCINYVLAFRLFTMILLLACICKFYQNFQKRLLFESSHRKLSILHERIPRMVRISLIFTKKNIMRQSSCFDIEYWRSHRPFMSGKLKHARLYIILTTVTFLIFNRIIFRLDSFQPHQPPDISSTRMPVSII